MAASKFISLNAATATGLGTAMLIGEPRGGHSMQVVYTGSPTVVKVTLLGSMDGTNYFIIAAFDTAAGDTNGKIISSPFYMCTHLNAQLVTLTAGTSPTVTVEIASESGASGGAGGDASHPVFTSSADIGAKADAAATDSTSSWSVIALLKGMLAQLLSTSPVQTYTSNTYANITTQTTTTLKSGAGTLSRIIVNKATASGVITIYDNTAGSGTLIGTITNPGTLLAEGPLVAPYDCTFGTGLTIVTSGATQDITVVYR